MSSHYCRRHFIATHSAALLAAPLAPSLPAEPSAPKDPAKLARDGGARAVQTRGGKWVRWDEREKLQLASAVDQPSLFYWAGKANRQTALFVERFKQHCPLEHVMTCSSGTAAVHVAIA